MKLSVNNTFRRLLHRRRPSAVSAVFLIVCLAATLLSGCGLENGSDTIAFLRGKALWAIDPDGSNLRMLAQGNIVSVAWSPDHHQYVMRLAQQFAPPVPLSLLGAPDAPGELAVGSVNGGSTTQITPITCGIVT